MPNTREKLIDLIETTVPREKVAAYGEVPVTVGRIADHLIANGVTVDECTKDCKNCWKTKLVNPANEWIPVTERLPKPFTPVLVYRQSFGTLPPYIKVDKMTLWNDDTQVWTDEVGNWKNVTTHWMPLPQPPEGVGE